jgi:hypothetical protein
MYAPPIPYGEYTKDYAGSVHEGIGMAKGLVAGKAYGLLGHLHGLKGKLCGLCGGAGHLNGGACGGCGGDGFCGEGDPGCGDGFGHGHSGGGHGLLGHGHGGSGCGPGCGHGHGGGHGLGLGHWLGKKGHGHGGGGLGHGHGLGLGHGPLCGPGQDCASPQGTTVVGSPQGAMPSGQGLTAITCGGCAGMGHINGGPCGLCGGSKSLLRGHVMCKGCGGKGLMHGGDPCGGCGGKGLLAGLLHNACGGSGCGGCGGDGLMGGHNLCGGCGGKGCGMCGHSGMIHKLVGLPHHLTSAVHGAAATVFHKGDIEYFVGPGGPVPLTPGYVPYVVPVRSPRDYFAFPPFTDRAFP